ncbi:NAD(P)H-dependent oxidoreductase [Labedella endophytica]|uniref:Flavodoxin family protein n=1 Tax=Labedella endophytica TaxID=1523160 RepID=A0A433JMR8_9MICO|nr:NAD(P)H-dependent oxidoreductase [Labedella endophytica]RUQ96917.1 flavodoxin family protein [Labedella endophytica]
MSTLIVIAHPDPDSLTHHAAAALGDVLAEGDVSTADLAQEGFDPRFTLDDRAAYAEQRVLDPAIVSEQRRIDAAEHLVLVFPVYWWSMPALLKGWIDRVFVGPWAFEVGADDRIVPKLQNLTVHLLPVSGTARESFARHGYTESLRTQIEHGVVDYCGAQRGVTAFIHESEADDAEAVAGELESAVAAIAAAIARPSTPS